MSGEGKKEEIIGKLQKMCDQPGGQMAARFCLNAAGGPLAAAAALWSELDQEKFNQEITDFAAEANSDFNQLGAAIEKLLSLHPDPTPATLALLLGELFGDEKTSQLLSVLPNQIHAFLHPTTVEEFQPYVKLGWVTLRPTHNQCNMGAGNRMGNCIEEQKRAYGMGSSFIVTLLDVEQLVLPT